MLVWRQCATYCYDVLSAFCVCFECVLSVGERECVSVFGVRRGVCCKVRGSDVGSERRERVCEEV